MGCKCSKCEFEIDSSEVKGKEKSIYNPKRLNYDAKNIRPSTTDEDFKTCINRPYFKTNLSLYEERVFEIFNEIRAHPTKFAPFVEDAINNIQVEKIPEYDIKTGEDVFIEKIIYKQRVKVALNRGKPAFLEAAEYLRQTRPMKKLTFDNSLVIPLPEKEEYLKDPTFFKKTCVELGIKDRIKVFFKDLIKDPDVSALLMIVDDNKKSPGKKRNAILDPENKYVGISSKFYEKSFAAIFCFSSKEPENNSLK